jgi:L-rhamnose mutarotase
VHRVCFTLQVKRDRMEEYTERHAAVWPDMCQALHDTGWHNYSLFLREDGLLVGYLETPDLAAAQEGMARTDVNARWQAEMGEFFEDLDLPPDQGFWQLSEVFHLEDQLAAHTTTHTSPTPGSSSHQDQ